MDGVTVDENEKAGGSKKDDDELLAVARDRFNKAESAWSGQRRDATEDIRFRSGEQWPEEIRRAREQDNRPCLSVNQLPQYIRQVVNDQKRNRPSIQVSAVDSTADPDTAIVLQAIIRNLEYKSDADLAYDTAFESAATCGLGYFRIKTDYCDSNSFYQDLKICPVSNLFSVYTDPQAEDPYLTDATFAFVFEEVSKDDYKRRFPDSEVVSANWTSEYSSSQGWVNEDTVRLAEYYYVEYKPKEIVQLDDGSVMTADAYEEKFASVQRVVGVLSSAQLLMDGVPKAPKVLNRRKSEERVVNYVLTNGVEILDRTVWPGSTIPIVPVIADSYMKDNIRVFEGIVRHARDPQRMYNFWVSAETEMIALAPKAPFIGGAGQFENFEKQWSQANTRNLPYLEYNPVASNGTPLPPPTRNAYEPPVQAITNARGLAREDMKATTGIYDPSLGIASREESGVAVMARQYQAGTTNFHYVDNLCKSLRRAGKIILEVLPKIYDAPRIVRITGDEERVVRVGANVTQDPENGDYTLGVGTYDVVVEPGESNTTARQESIRVLAELAKVAPQIIMTCGDLIVRNLDIPEAGEMAERMKRMLPPELQPNEGIPPKAQMLIQQLQQKSVQQMQELGLRMQQMQEILAATTSRANALQAKVDSQQMQTESKERIEFAKMKVDLIKDLSHVDPMTAAQMADREISAIDEQLFVLGEGQPVKPQPASAAPGEEQYIIPGINDPVTELQKANERIRSLQLNAQASGARAARSAAAEATGGGGAGSPLGVVGNEGLPPEIPVVPHTPANIKGRGPVSRAASILGEGQNF